MTTTIELHEWEPWHPSSANLIVFYESNSKCTWCQSNFQTIFLAIYKPQISAIRNKDMPRYLTKPTSHLSISSQQTLPQLADWFGLTDPLELNLIQPNCGTCHLAFFLDIALQIEAVTWDQFYVTYEDCLLSSSCILS